MHRWVFVAFIAVAGCAGTLYGDQPVVYGGSSGDFYSQLSPYGQWVDTQYGQAWQPSVGGDFVPYATNGQWVNTDYGWTFDSSYPWGQVAFHYGNWYQDPSYGWIWFPGDQWAPAWVDWRYGNDTIGWAPRPPARISARAVFNNNPNRWYFVNSRNFSQPRVDRFTRRDVNAWNRTQPIRNPVTVHGSTWNRGPDARHVESVTGRPVPYRQIQPQGPIQRVRGQDRPAQPQRGQPQRPNVQVHDHTN